jgi:hypothetical protein
MQKAQHGVQIYIGGTFGASRKRAGRPFARIKSGNAPGSADFEGRPEEVHTFEFCFLSGFSLGLEFGLEMETEISGSGRFEFFNVSSPLKEL